MRKICCILAAIALSAGLLVFSSAPASAAPLAQDNQTTVPQNRKRPHKYERHRGHGIGHSYKKGGRSMGRGGKRFGRNMARGKPIKAGKELGKGVGGLGKHTGIGTAKVGRKTGRAVKHAVTP